MNRLLQRLCRVTLLAAAALCALAAIAYITGIRINTTKSIALGVYRTIADPVEKGAYVMFCPPPEGAFALARARNYIGPGACPGGYGYLMKRVLAAADDIVTIAGEGVRVNGELLPFSAPLEGDKAGRPLRRFASERFRLGASELLLMSDVSATSFDARYFGPVDRAQVRDVIRPLLTW